ncbi:MAG: hypothetical protein J6A75_13410 [Lachnospiraceae bacterium]|nr:hypothetical protein [Lachnospiraceae bacterium]
MKVITAVNKYKKTDKELFLQCVKDGTFVVVHKDKDFHLAFGSRIADSRVHHIDEKESPDAVTIYI